MLQFLLFAAVTANPCPSSPAQPHASCQVVATATTSCSNVMSEMILRANGTHDGSWIDPHNNGTYTVENQTATQLWLRRLTGSHKPGPYTDQILFTLSGSGSSCSIAGCSASQVQSIQDFSTNYCNQRNLYCGKADGCKYIKYDYDMTETSVEPSPGAGSNKTACIVV